MNGLEPVILGAFALSVVGTGGVLHWLRERQILDIPNSRSSHAVPTPRGGGLAVTPTILLVWAILAASGRAQPGTAPILIVAVVLMGLSWLDDLKGLSARLRFLVHALAALVGVSLLGDGRLVFQGLLPLPLDRLAAALLWLWFINLYNFMDGVDGLTGVETISLGAGLAILAKTGAAAQPAALGAAALGFLVWNWHPAKIFLGDSGSIPLGFLLGWLLLSAAADGQWAAALILPAYYLADATLTLARRLARGEKVWQAHREHFYQQAVQGGVGHSAVSFAVLIVDAVLIVLAGWSQAHPVAAIILAAGLVGTLLTLFWARGRKIVPSRK